MLEELHPTLELINMEEDLLRTTALQALRVWEWGQSESVGI